MTLAWSVLGLFSIVGGVLFALAVGMSACPIGRGRFCILFPRGNRPAGSNPECLPDVPDCDVRLYIRESLAAYTGAGLVLRREEQIRINYA
jgi:hypothetical protein